MKLFHREYGEGKPIIIVHGLFGMSDNWITIAKQLTASFKVFLLDLRNHGQSPHNVIHDYQSMSEDINEFIIEKKIEKAILIGHSMGGKVVMQFANNYPEKVEQMIIVDISPKTYTDNNDFSETANNHPELLKRMKELDVGLLKNRNEVQTYFKKYFNDEFLLQLIQKNIKKNKQHKFVWKLNVEVLYKNLEEIKNEIHLDDEIKFIKTLFVFGSYSPYFRNEDRVYIQNNMPYATINLIHGAGHLLHISHEKEFIKIISGFLK